MLIKVYIEPNGDVTITTMTGDLVPVAHSLDQTDQQMQLRLEILSEINEDRLEEGEKIYGGVSTRRVVDG